MSEPCPTCGKIYHWRRKRLRETGVVSHTIGRPRKESWEKIYQLRDSGLTYREIAQRLNIGFGAVNNALRMRMK